MRRYDEVVHGRGKAHEPLLAVLVMREAHDHELVRAFLHQRAVGVKVLPGARLAVDLHAGAALQPLHELVMNRGVRERLLHQRRERRGDEATFLEQPVEARDLESGGTVREVVDRIALVGVLAAVALADPEAAVPLRVVERDGRRLQDGEQPIVADPIEDARGSLVAREADHPGDFAEVRVIERNAPALGFHERAEEDGKLRQARCIDHLVAVQHREPRRIALREVDERERQPARLDLAGEPEITDDALQPVLERRIGAVLEVAHRGLRQRDARRRRQRERRTKSRESA